MNLKIAPTPHLLDELQSALAHGSVARRVETLRKVTDLFLSGSIDYSDEQLEVFDDVFVCLISHIEAAARILLAERLAPIAGAPPRTIRALAFDDLIEVAAPVLAQSDRLDDAMLIDNARTKSQQHLLAISTRKALSHAVTDVLIERGDNRVVQSTVNNPGADFSERGYTTLLTRAEDSDDIAVCVALRPSMPRHHYLKLIARASHAVRARLAAANPDAARDVSLAVEEALRNARVTPGAIGPDTLNAQRLVRSLYEDGRLDDFQVAAFAEADKFDETNAAIACLAHVPLSVAETMMIEAPAEGIFVLAKVASLSWPTVKAVIQMREKLAGQTAGNLDDERPVYERLRTSTAQQVLRFQRMQERTSMAL